MIPNKRKNRLTIGLDEVLDDLSSRFILNCPEEEYESFERLYFQIEEAFWFYCDFYRVNYSNLPSLTLKKFGHKIFEHCPLLFQYYHAYEEVFELFNEYKCSVPVMGAIMLNPNMTKVVLVQGWKSKTWGFPRGKISRSESEESCAIREVLEETGYDISPKLCSEHFIQRKLSNSQRAKMFIVTNVPEDTVFKTQTRNEIRSIEWFPINKLCTWKSSKNSPFVKKNKLYKVLTFMKELNVWIADEKKGRHKRRFKTRSSKSPTTSLKKPNRVPYTAAAQISKPVSMNDITVDQHRADRCQLPTASHSLDSFFDIQPNTLQANSMLGFKFDTQDLLGVLN